MYIFLNISQSLIVLKIRFIEKDFAKVLIKVKKLFKFN